MLEYHRTATREPTAVKMMRDIGLVIALAIYSMREGVIVVMLSSWTALIALLM